MSDEHMASADVKFDNPKHLCDVCGKNPVVGVASSTLAPMSHALCQRCLTEGYEAMGVIIGSLSGMRSMHAIAPEFREIVRRSLQFHKVTEEKLFEMVAAHDRDYDEYVRKHTF